MIYAYSHQSPRAENMRKSLRILFLATTALVSYGQVSKSFVNRVTKDPKLSGTAESQKSVQTLTKNISTLDISMVYLDMQDLKQ